MQTVRILQAVLLMAVLATAASCATSNEYVSKILKPRNAPEPVLAQKEPKPVRFLEFDSTDEESETWVKGWINKDSSAVAVSETFPVIDESKKVWPPKYEKEETVVIAKTEVKDPKKKKVLPPKEIKEDSVAVEKSTPIMTDPVARTENPDGTRTKKTRD